MGRRDDEYWAEFFGIAPQRWSEAGVLFRPHAGLDYQGLWCFRRLRRVVVSAPSAWITALEKRWRDWSPDWLLDPDRVQASLGEQCERCIGPAFQGCVEPQSFRLVVAPSVRALNPGDHQTVDRFRHVCGEAAWADSGLEQAEVMRFAWFDGDRITAMSALRGRGKLVGDVCVLTHPECRSMGRGRAVVSATVKRAVEGGHLVLYQTLESNVAAVGLALGLGLRRYANHVAVRLAQPEAPSGW